MTAPRWLRRFWCGVVGHDLPIKEFFEASKPSIDYVEMIVHGSTQCSVTMNSGLEALPVNCRRCGKEIK